MKLEVTERELYLLTLATSLKLAQLEGIPPPLADEVLKDYADLHNVLVAGLEKFKGSESKDG